MNIAKCPKCHAALQINISNASDEHGEIFQCPKCGYYFGYGRGRY